MRIVFLKLWNFPFLLSFTVTMASSSASERLSCSGCVGETEPSVTSAGGDLSPPLPRAAWLTIGSDETEVSPEVPLGGLMAEAPLADTLWTRDELEVVLAEAEAEDEDEDDEGNPRRVPPLLLVRSVEGEGTGD